MRPFKIFFGLSLAVMLFFFVAKFFVFAFITATVLSIIYALYRKIKYFITYDRNGEYYFKGFESSSRHLAYEGNQTEPLFYGDRPSRNHSEENIRFVDIH